MFPIKILVENNKVSLGVYGFQKELHKKCRNLMEINIVLENHLILATRVKYF
jgi:hypothetical protein